MKQFIKILSLSFMVATLSGCFDDPGTEITLSDRFVSFSVPSQQINENAGSGNILVEVSYAQSSAVQINFNLTTSNAVNGIDFNLPTTSVTIPAGEFSTQIPFTVVDNDNFEPLARTFTVTITSVSVEGVSIQGNSSVTVSILNDDCPANTSVWYGTVSVEDVGFGSNDGTGAANANGDCNILVVTGDYVGAVASVTWVLTPSSPGAKNGTAVAVRQPYACCAEAYTYEALNGTYDEETGIIEADYTFYRASGAVFFTGTTVISVN